MALAGETTLLAAIDKLEPQVMAAIKADGSLDTGSQLVQALEGLGRGQGAGPDGLKSGPLETTRSPQAAKAIGTSQ
jgi:hypothetical protein